MLNSKISKIGNLHIHNSNSRCCWNRYPIKILYEEAKKARLQYVGSTNHVYPPYKGIDGQPIDIFQRHIIWTKEEIQQLNLSNSEPSLFLGCEVDITNSSGQSFLLPKYKKMVDYWIAGMHSYFNLNILKSMYIRAEDEREDFLQDYFEEWGDWAVNFINISTPDIFVHPFWQELEHGLFHKKFMFETAQRIFEAASNKGTAIECSALQIRVRNPIPPFWILNDPRGNHQEYFMKFYTDLYRLAKENNCKIAFGSDAHIPEQIKDVIVIKELLENVGFEDKDIYIPTKNQN